MIKEAGLFPGLFALGLLHTSTGFHSNPGTVLWFSASTSPSKCLEFIDVLVYFFTVTLSALTKRTLYER